MRIFHRVALMLVGLVFGQGVSCDRVGGYSSVLLNENGKPPDLSTVYSGDGPVGPYVRGYSVLEEIGSRVVGDLGGAGQDLGDGLFYGPSRSPEYAAGYVWWLKIEGYDPAVLRPFRRETPRLDLVRATTAVLCRELYGAPTEWRNCPMTIEVLGPEGVPEGVQVGAFGAVVPAELGVGVFEVDAVAGSADGVTFATDVLVTAPGYMPFAACVQCDDVVTATLVAHDYGCAVVRAPAPERATGMRAFVALLLAPVLAARRRRRGTL